MTLFKSQTVKLGAVAHSLKNSMSMNGSIIMLGSINRAKKDKAYELIMQAKTILEAIE